MKMRLYLFLLFSVIGLHGIHAQEKFVFGVPSAVRTVFFQPCYIKDSTLVGQADLSVKYRLTRRAGDSLYKWCLLKLMAGDGISSQIDELEYFNSLIMTELNSGAVGVNASLRSKAGMMGDAPSNLFLQMVRRDKEGILEVTGSDMQTINRTRMYKEPVPDIEWTVEEGIDSLYGYPCMKATAQFRGQDLDCMVYHGHSHWTGTVETGRSSRFDPEGDGSNPERIVSSAWNSRRHESLCMSTIIPTSRQ